MAMFLGRVRVNFTIRPTTSLIQLIINYQNSSTLIAKRKRTRIIAANSHFSRGRYTHFTKAG